MADVADTLPEWSSTSANNGPSGATTIGTGLDDNLRECQGVVTRWLSHKGSDIASAATTDIGAVEGLMHDITGTATVTGFGTIRSGIWKVLKFEGAAILTHNATSLILPGAQNIVTADGDVGIFMSEGSGNWRCLHYMKAAGGVLGPVLGTAQATTSGTAINFTGIPSWVKRITVMFDQVSTNGTSVYLVQIGDSGDIETTGYVSGAWQGGSGDTTGTSTAGFAVVASAAVAANNYTGTVVLTKMDGDKWVSAGSLNRNDGAGQLSNGVKTLSATLDRVRITTANGTDTFDSGAANILYE
jgi:hypothetical protein